MKFKKVIALELVAQWQDRYVNFYHLKECINHHAQLSIAIQKDKEEEEETNSNDNSANNSQSNIIKNMKEEEERNKKQIEKYAMTRKRRGSNAAEKKPHIKVFESFEVELSKEAQKVNAFFKSRQDKFSARLQELTSEIDLMKNGGNITPGTINALRKAYHDNHLQWKLLRKFQETNKYGFLKILKRHDTQLKQNQFDYFLENYLQNTSVWDSKFIEDTIAETKGVYTKYFAASDERLAKSELRRSHEKRAMINIFSSAIFLGAMLSIFVICVYAWVKHYPSNPPSFASVGWFVYRICLLPILLGVLFSFSTYLWERDNINYVFIFKFNPLHYRSPMMYLKYSLCIFSIWLLSFYLFLDSVISNTRVFYGLLHPLIFVVVLVTGFFLPLPILGHHTRFYLIKEISRVLRAGLPGRINVSFADFIMAIKLIALSEFLFDFQIMFCMFGLRDDQLCEGNSVIALPFLSALPHWCRMFQCVRRWRQTGHAYPHLASGIRPFTTLISLSLSVLSNNYPEYKAIRYVWIVLNSIFSVIRWYLDILIDWSFVKFGFDFSLREQRLYKPTWLYYFVMADNFFLRFVWLIVYLMRTEGGLDMNHPMLLLLLSSFELLWGFQFVFFRMENEHFNCKDRYDIIHDVPLPFTKKYEALARKNTIKAARREKRLHRHSCWDFTTEVWNKMPWVNSRRKLRKSIAKAIREVEREHPNRKPTMPNFTSFSNLPNFTSFANLPNFSDSSSKLERRHMTSLATTPHYLSPATSFARLSMRLTSPSQMKRASTSLSPLSNYDLTNFSNFNNFNNDPHNTPAHTPDHSPKESPNNSPPPSPPISPKHSSSPHIEISSSSSSSSSSPSSSPPASASSARSPVFSPSFSIPRSHSFSLTRRPSLHHSSELRSYTPLAEPKQKKKERESDNENEDEDDDGEHGKEKEKDREKEKEKERERKKHVKKDVPMLSDYSPNITVPSPDIDGNFIL